MDGSLGRDGLPITFPRIVDCGLTGDTLDIDVLQ
jgi:hypothetical protein